MAPLSLYNMISALFVVGGLSLLLPSVRAQQHQEKETTVLSLPSVSVYMLCANDNIESIDFSIEMEGYYYDLLTDGDDGDAAAAAVEDVTVSGTQEFEDCRLEPDQTQTRLVFDGTVQLLLTANNGTTTTPTWTEDTIRELVTSYSLENYFAGLCVDGMEVFEAEIREASSSATTTLFGVDSIAERYVSAICHISQPEAIAAGVTGVTIALIAIFILLFLCVCTFCCVCRKR